MYAYKYRYLQHSTASWTPGLPISPSCLNPLEWIRRPLGASSWLQSGLQ